MTLDPHVEDIASAIPGRRMIVSHPVTGTIAPHVLRRTIPPGTRGVVRAATPEALDFDTRWGGGIYIVRIGRDDFPHVDLEPQR